MVTNVVASRASLQANKRRLPHPITGCSREISFRPFPYFYISFIFSLDIVTLTDTNCFPPIEGTLEVAVVDKNNFTVQYDIENPGDKGRWIPLNGTRHHMPLHLVGNEHVFVYLYSHSYLFCLSQFSLNIFIPHSLRFLSITSVRLPFILEDTTSTTTSSRTLSVRPSTHSNTVRAALRSTISRILIIFSQNILPKKMMCLKIL